MHLRPDPVSIEYLLGSRVRRSAQYKLAAKMPKAVAMTRTTMAARA
jgi:hypothetical protein